MRYASLALVVALGPVATAQTLLYQHTEGSGYVPSALLGFGKSIAGLGDLDGDGVTEFAISSDGYDWSSSGQSQGVVRIYSGTNGGFLYQVDAPSSGLGFGTVLAGLGDVDGDGHGDLAVGAPKTGFGGEVYLHSGADGHLIRILDNVPYGAQFGTVLDALGDVDGDGRGDLIIGAPFAQVGSIFPGLARVVSGASGATLYEVAGVAASDQCGASVAGPGDVDADGTPDFAFSIPNFDGAYSNTGTVRIHSGFDGSLLHEFQGGAPGTNTGLRIAGLGDANGDGFADLTLHVFNGQMGVLSGKTGTLLHTFPLSYVSPGRIGDVDGDGFDDVGFADSGSNPSVSTFSGRTGMLIYEVFPPKPGFTWFLTHVAGLGDLNGDGRDDFAVGTSAPGALGSGFVYSGATWVPPGTVTCKGDGTGAMCPCQGSALYYEGFDGGVLPAGWTASGLWHVTSACGGCSGSDPHAYFGWDFNCTYNPAPAVSSLLSPPISVPSQGRLLLDFCTQIDMDAEGHRAWVKVHGSSGTTLQFYAGNSVCCQKELPPYDITELIGQTIQIEYYFSIDINFFSDKGWQVDDVVLRWEPNYGEAGEGCLNSTLNGGLLGAVGSSSKSADDLVLMATHLPKNNNGIYLVGNGEHVPPIPYQAGLVCAGGTTVRYPAANSGSYGALHLTQPFAFVSPYFQPGSTYMFQAWYRDSALTAPCGKTSNLTNGYSVTVTP